MSQFNLGDIFQQAQKMRDELSRVQEEVGKRTMEVTAGGGMVKVVINGKQEIVSITLDPSVFNMNDRCLLQDLIKAGVNEAIDCSKKWVTEEIGKSSGLGPLASMLRGS